MPRPNISMFLLGTVLLMGRAATGASFGIYLSPPTNQSSSIAGVTTETFNSLAVGNRTTAYTSAIGTYQTSASTPLAVLNADQYGGASGSKYVSIGAQSGTSAPVTLNLNGNYNYFGFWSSASDNNAGVSFYSGTTLLVRYSTTTLVSFLTAKNLTALNGSTYKSSAYLGNPNNGLNAGEGFAYVNILAAGITFDRVMFDNSGVITSGFESDNHSIANGTVIIPTNHVAMQTLVSVSVPEPGTFSMFLFGGVLLGVGVALKRRVPYTRF